MERKPNHLESHFAFAVLAIGVAAFAQTPAAGSPVLTRGKEMCRWT